MITRSKEDGCDWDRWHHWSMRTWMRKRRRRWDGPGKRSTRTWVEVVQCGRYADSQIHFHSNLCLQDFDSIFGTLLPNTNAKLEPPQGMDETEGLEIKAWIHPSVFSILAVSLSELTGCIPWSLEAVPDRAQWWTTIASCTFPGLGTFALQASTDVPRFRFRDFELNWYWGNFTCWASSYTPPKKI